MNHKNFRYLVFQQFDIVGNTVCIYFRKKYAPFFGSFRFWAILLVVLLAMGGCSPGSKNSGETHGVTVEEDHSYGRAMGIGPIKNREIDEASGLVVHRGNPNLLWTHNDSGGEARLFLFQRNGTFRAEYHLQGTTNRDWEDIASGPGPQPNINYLYIGDIGDNYTLYFDYVIYRLKEPADPTESGKGGKSKIVTEVEELRFVYPDGSHDAETLFIDPATRDLYIVTRQETQDRVYRYTYPQSTTTTDTVEFVGKLPFAQFAGGDLSADGQTLLLKTLPQIFIWRREAGESIAEMLSNKPREVVPYGTGPQEEAIAIDPQRHGFYTLSESKGKPVTLYYNPVKSKDKDGDK
ncbi:hypothetical protein [Fodinibius salsisoli]|uniref:PE-PGRS family protein n=1 Tax=Fodinibius salsisoli TaxID=2820877 RepID=A0ABT3PKE9_9BACT|nr:hypothetical protein [Fodinibius salsisoli]MCW9706392.1 hypothetical protein [Fodinibius salsisoli]